MNPQGDLTLKSTLHRPQSSFPPEQMSRLMNIINEHNRLNMMLFSERYHPLSMHPAASPQPSTSPTQTDCETTMSLSTKKSPHSPKRIPRPNNSFMTYRKDKQKSNLDAHPGINNKEVSKIVGEMWRNESEDIKEFYRKKAEQGKRDHALKYPGYKYTPRKRQRRASPSEEIPSSQKMKEDFLSFTSSTDGHLPMPYHPRDIYNMDGKQIGEQYPMESNLWEFPGGPLETTLPYNFVNTNDSSFMEKSAAFNRERWNALNIDLSPSETHYRYLTKHFSEHEDLHDLFTRYINPEAVSGFTTYPGIPTSTRDPSIIADVESEQPCRQTYTTDEFLYNHRAYDPVTHLLPEHSDFSNSSSDSKVSSFEANIQQFQGFLNDILSSSSNNN
ncbi:hypothetical protein K7432_008196 [Basidiobolus ranarum]|uniref:HMG box domain-containing protein n=1 Tax=Basidiobolus ranarum TaxID=34480 RepID=A0ABR2VZG4_9FUNG